MLTTKLLAALVLLLTVAAPSWAQQELARLLPADGLGDDLFGDSVEMYGDTLVVGARYHPEVGFDSGGAYLFDVVTGTQLHELQPLGLIPYVQFGTAVAVNGQVAVATSPWDNEMGQAAGAAFVFDTSTAAQLWKLTASDGLPGDFFGDSVAVSDSYIVVGAEERDELGDRSGAAYVYSSSTGTQIHKLLPSDGMAFDYFGAAVAVDRNRIIIGAPGSGGGAGAAYVFDASTGAQLFKLLPSGVLPHVGFGFSVELEAELAVVGEPSHDIPFSNIGAAFVFDVVTGGQKAKLQASDGAAQDNFGYSVTISGTRVVVGAEGDDTNGNSSGSAYLFEAHTGLQLSKLMPADGSGGDRFGRSVALHGDRLAVGTPRDSEDSIFMGSVYTFDVPTELGVAYCFGDGSGNACPCANNGAPGRGCASGASSQGSVLFGVGVPSLTQDSFQLVVVDVQPGQPGVFLGAQNQIQGGSGLLFGDGLRCAGGALIRYPVGIADASGVRFSHGGHGAGLTAGATRRYQYWYRNPAGSPCGSGFNLSNGYEVVWLP